MRRTTALLLLTCLFALPADAGPDRDLLPASAVEMKNEERVALVIGNGEYSVGPLRNPPSDARAVAKALEDLGFKVRLAIDQDLQGMRTAIVDFGLSLKAGGVGLFYYAGHGIQVGGHNYLVPVGAEISGEPYVKVRAIDLNEVLVEMEGAKNRLNIVILDACRNNPFERSFRSSASGLASVDAPKGTLVAYATSPGTVAEDGAGANSSYTAALVRNMARSGAKVEEVFKSVREEVLQTTNGRQTPWENTSLVGDFYFSFPAAAPTSGPVAATPADPPRPSKPISSTASAGSDTDVSGLAAREKEFQTRTDGLLATAAQEWADVQPLLAKPTPGTRKVVSAFVEKWDAGKATVTVEGETRPVEIPEAAKAKDWLASTAGATPGNAAPDGAAAPGNASGEARAGGTTKPEKGSRAMSILASIAEGLAAGAIGANDVPLVTIDGDLPAFYQMFIDGQDAGAFPHIATVYAGTHDIILVSEPEVLCWRGTFDIEPSADGSAVVFDIVAFGGYSGNVPCETIFDMSDDTGR